MLAVALGISVFVVATVIGCGAYTALRISLSAAPIALTAPVLGTALTVDVLFVISRLGAPMATAGPVAVLALLSISGFALVATRARLPKTMLAVSAIAVASVWIVGRPFLRYGFDWIANANDDMANYVLSAQLLLHRGLTSGLDVAALTHDRDLSSALQVIHSIGARPGADILLSAVSATAREGPLQTFMPLILALNACAVCAVGALVLQGTKRAWGAAAGGALFAVAPLATYSILQQLLPQVWGLGIACALLALALRTEIHQGSRTLSWRVIAVVGTLVVATVVVYIELAATIGAVYLLFVLVGLVRRRVSVRALARVWLPVAGLAIIVLNSYGLSEAAFVREQMTKGFGSPHAAPLFGYSLLPSALAAVVGLQEFDPSRNAHFLDLSIEVALVALVAALIAALRGTWKGVAAMCALVAYALLGVDLQLHNSDFGLFKLEMYVQPFLAAATAIWLARLRDSGRPRLALGLLAVPVALIAVVAIGTQQRYVQRSFDPIDLRDASAPALLPEVGRVLESGSHPIILATENPVLAKLASAYAPRGRRVVLIGRNVQEELLDSYLGTQSPKLRATVSRINRSDGWLTREFPLRRGLDIFEDNRHANAILRRQTCEIVFPTGRQLPFNRLTLPETSEKDVAVQRCPSMHNLLIFTQSELGQSYYRFGQRTDVSFYQLENDYFFHGRTFAGFGRRALFRVLNPSHRVRLVLSLTTTVRRVGANRLPPAAVIGSSSVPLPLVGRGSARVISGPFSPRIIDGQPWVLLDMGVPGLIQPTRRRGIQALYGGDVPLDPRYLTSYVRDVSLISARARPGSQPPSDIAQFPQGLAASNLAYSGYYEDGWTAEDSYVVLASRHRHALKVEADVLPIHGQRLSVLVDGSRAFTGHVKAGLLELTVRVPSDAPTHRIELRWRRVTPLGPQDPRLAAARIRYIGFAAPPAALDAPADLALPGAFVKGVDRDGWVRRVASITLAGGPAGLLVLRAQVPEGERHERLRVRIPGQTVRDVAVPPGEATVELPAPASDGARRIEFQWSAASRLSPRDARRVAARLMYIGVVPVKTPRQVTIPAGLVERGLVYNGIYADGWAKRRASIVLAGGKAAMLSVAVRSSLPRQRVTIDVNGANVGTVDVPVGKTTVKLKVPATAKPRRVELRFSRQARIGTGDPRLAAALLRTIAVENR